MYPKAKELKKKFDKKFIDEVFEKIVSKQSSGRLVKTVGKYSCTSATKEELIRILKENDYGVQNSFNSHGVPTLVITW